jgi:predicted acylesterase/phospholipase RssA
MAARTAFVLSGGASLGAIQVGMLQALYERGVEPDLIVGSSVGALNGGFIASRPPTVSSLRRIVDAEISFDRLEEAETPFHVIATDAEARLIVLPPPCPLDVLPIDFSRTDELIERGLRDARGYLREVDGGATVPLAMTMHDHRPRAAAPAEPEAAAGAAAALSSPR